MCAYMCLYVYWYVCQETIITYSVFHVYLQEWWLEMKSIELGSDECHCIHIYYWLGTWELPGTMPQCRYMLVEEDVPTVIVFNRFDIMRESFQGHYPQMTHFVHVYIYIFSLAATSEFLPFLLLDFVCQYILCNMLSA